MKKQDLEAILGSSDLGPIEGYLYALATQPELPELEIAHCTVRIEEAAPTLRALLAKAADGEPLLEQAELLLFRGLYILGAARDSASCKPLLRLLRRPGDEVEALFGDAVSESMAKVVAGVFDGDADTLFDMIADCSLDPFVRDALIGAAAFLTWDGCIADERMRACLVRFDAERLADADDITWAGWQQAIALLGLRDMAPLVARAWDDGRMPEAVYEREDFEEDLAAAEQHPDEIERFRNRNLGYIDDVVDELNHLDRMWQVQDDAPFDDDEDVFATDEDLDREWGWQPQEPVRNPMRHVGRNDPCPCGSGRKAKKCCLARGEPPI